MMQLIRRFGIKIIRNGHRAVSILVVVFMLLGVHSILFQTPNGGCNPISVDDGNSMNPFPYEVTNVYMKSELIQVTFSKLARVRAAYTFHHEGNASTIITIVLPFWSKPANINLECDDGNDIDFTNGDFRPPILEDEISDDNRLYVGGREVEITRLDSICFNVSFLPDEMKTIYVNYSREYEMYDFPMNEKIHYSFIYIISTACYWNHSIDHAKFEFFIPDEIIDKTTMYDDYPYNSTHHDGNRVITIDLSDLNLSREYSGEIYIQWISYRDNWFEDNIVENKYELFSMMIMITIILSIHRKRHKQGLN